MRPTSNYELRAADPAEVVDVVDLHLEAFPQFFLSSLGPRFLGLFYQGLIDCPSGILLVARSQSHGPTGFVGGAVDESAFFKWLLDNRRVEFLLEAAKLGVRHPNKIPRLWRARRRDASAASFPEPASLLTIGTHPTARGTGVGRSLLLAFEEQLLEAGSLSYHLTTDAYENEVANRFYAANGMERAGRLSTPEGRVMFIWRRSLEQDLQRRESRQEVSE